MEEKCYFSEDEFKFYIELLSTSFEHKDDKLNTNDILIVFIDLIHGTIKMPVNEGKKEMYIQFLMKKIKESII